MSESNTKVRSVTINDLSTLQSIAQSTFIATYEAYNTAENMKQYLNEHFSIERLQTEISNPNVLFFFLEDQGQIVGYTKLNLNKSQTESKYPNTLEIERIYVLSNYQGKGLGVVLLTHAVETARQLTLTSVWLGVWDQNLKAIAFYERNGFIKFGMHKFILGNEPQSDHIMKFDL